ncbi:uncharacterized protein [Clytia hemisphaerica]|uniref:uncharacterized protein n=1 Tax=Clytia hemisphaerica TaxID=252671 RepID=UPI0034D3A4CF
MTSSTGYGPSANNLWQNIAFDGDERKFELWEVKFLGYMNIRKLKHVFVSEDEITAEKNELAFSELIQFLDERSISLIMRDARDNGRLAFKILKEHYAASGKPRIITLYTQLTSLIKRNNESITDYILRAESAANALRTAKETVSDGLLVAMVVKGLPDQYKSFIAVTTQSEDVVQDFQKFKQALKNLEDTEQTRNKRPDSTEGDNIMKTDSYRTKKLTCFNCGAAGHKSTDCRKPKKQNTTNRIALEDSNKLLLKTSSDKFLVDCDATTHIVNTDSNFIDIDTTFKPDQHFIELADGSRSNNLAKKKGTVSISLLSSTGKVVNAKLDNVLYVPSFPQCIFSVQAATKKGTKLNFEGDHAELITTDGTTFPIEQHGRLYYLSEFKALLLKYNIKHELTSPYSPHQNGTAERNWRTLFEMARSLLIEANLPKSLWTYAVLTATHIRNRCYVQRLKTTLYSTNATRLVKFTDKFETKPESDVLLPPTEPEEQEVKTETEPSKPVVSPEQRKSYPLRSRQQQMKDADVKEDSDSINHIDFCYLVNAPLTYQEAMTSSDSQKWAAAMDDEIKSLQLNNTYTLTEPPENKSIVGGKWVYHNQKSRLSNLQSQIRCQGIFSDPRD